MFNFKVSSHMCSLFMSFITARGLVAKGVMIHFSINSNISYRVLLNCICIIELGIPKQLGGEVLIYLKTKGCYTHHDVYDLSTASHGDLIVQINVLS